MQTFGRSGGSSLVCTLAEISRRPLISERGARVMCSATRVSGSIGVVERPEQKHLDSILTRIDEQWSVVKDPQHAKGILQMFRHCHTVGRNMPKRMMVRFALAKDAEAGKLWVLPDARGVFPGRGVHVASSYPSIAQASNWFAKAFQHGNLQLPNGMERIIEAELLRLTQRRLLEAFISATLVRCLHEKPLTVVEEEGQQPSEKTTASSKTFLETLDTAVSNAIAAQMKRSIETNTDVTKRTTWIIQMNDGKNKEQEDMMEVRALDGNKHHARVLHVLSSEEIRKALDVSRMPEDKTELQARHNELLSMLDGVEDIQKGTKGGEKLVLLCGVDNESSSRLQQEQLRLNIYRQTRAVTGSILETNLKARKSTQKGLRR